MAGILSDDGTMDTVICCDECGEESRYNYDGIQDPPCEHGKDDGCGDCYDAFVTECIQDFDDEHECQEEEADGDDENEA